MWEPELAHQLDLVSTPCSQGRRAPSAAPSEGENRCPVERTGEKGAGGVALVVIGEDDGRFQLRPKAFTNEARKTSFLLQPHRNRHAETCKTGRSVREVRLEQPLELAQRFLVEHDVIDLIGCRSGLAQAILDGVVGKSRVVLLAREPF